MYFKYQSHTFDTLREKSIQIQIISSKKWTINMISSNDEQFIFLKIFQKGHTRCQKSVLGKRPFKEHFILYKAFMCWLGGRPTLINPFPHTKNLPQTTLNIYRQTYGNYILIIEKSF